MRSLFLLLAAAGMVMLSACDAGDADALSEGPTTLPASVPNPLPVAVCGTSNADIMVATATDAFSATYASETGGGDAVFLDCAEGGRRVVPQPDILDWHPSSDGELFDMMSAEIEAFFDDYGTGVILWNQGNDALDIIDGLTTQAQYNDALNDLLDAFQAEFPLHPVVLIAATQNLDLDADDYAVWERFREEEIETCQAHPHCVVGAAVTDEILASYFACGTQDCEREWFLDRLHWGQAAAELAMAEAASAVVDLLAAED